MVKRLSSATYLLPIGKNMGLKQKLVGYKRIFLKSGETKRVEFRLTERKTTSMGYEIKSMGSFNTSI